MCITKVIFSFFPDTMYEYAKNQLNLLILEIQQIIGSHDLIGHTHIWLAHPITIKVMFSFPEYVLTCKKSAKFIYSFRNWSPMPIFDHNHPKIIKVILNFPEFASACKKSAQFIHSFIHSPYDQCLTTISDHTHPNIFLSTLNFWYQHVKKYRLFHHFVLDIYLIWNPSIWLANTNLALYEWETTNRFTDFTFG